MSAATCCSSRSLYRPVGDQTSPSACSTSADSHGDFIALPVTSRPQAEHGFPITPADMVSGQLPAPSWIRTNRIVTLNRTLVVKAVGRVSDALVAAAVERLCAHLRA